MQYIFNFAATNFTDMTPVPFATDLERLLRKGLKTAIISHFNPDGDAIGSSMGMLRFMQETGLDATAIIPSPVPEFLDFLDPDREIVCYKQDGERALASIRDAGLILCMDFNRPERTEWLAQPIVSASAVKVLVDHHPGPDTGKFNLVISDPEASSTCELLYRTLLSFRTIAGDPSRIGHDTLTALATGMITDTNNFNNSITPDTFSAASDMLRLGVDFDMINNLVFKRYTESRMRLMGHLLTDSMTIDGRLKASVMILTSVDKRKFRLSDGDSDGFVNLPLMIRDVEVSALFSETEDYVRVSLRSKGNISVNALSKASFNGGGHARAAGGRLYMPIDQVKEYFLRSLEQFLQNNRLGTHR